MSSREYARWREKCIREGIWGDQFVDPKDTRNHISKLMRRGLSRHDIANTSGVSPSTLRRIMNREIKRIWAVTEESILAVESTDDPGEVPAWRVRRRLEALMALGYSVSWVAAQIGVDYSGLHYISNEKFPVVRRRTWKPLFDLYEEIGDRPRVAGDSRERASITRTLERARKEGFAPPIAWDDIDNPRAVPQLREVAA